jgi:methyl-accepting chemotaxis protein
MKNLNISQRLFALLGTLLAALLLATALVVFAEIRDNTSKTRREAAITAAARIRYDMLQMSDAMRGMLVESSPDAERRRKLDADDDLAKAVDEAKDVLAAHPKLVVALAAVGDYDAKKLNQLENQFMDMVAKDRVAAIAFYTQSYLPARTEQDGLIELFTTHTHEEMDAEVDGADTLRTIAFSASGVILLLGVFAAFRLSRSLSRPLQALAAAAAAASEGDLTVNIPPRDSTDEIGQLTRAFTRLLDSLRAFSVAANRVAAGDLTVEFKPQSERDVMGNALAEMTRNLAALVSEVKKSSVQVNTSITEIAATAKEQQATASEIAATTTEIGATSKEISATSKELVKTMDEVSNVAEQSAALAGSGQAGLTRMEDTMRQIMSAAGAINSKLAVLNEKAGNINQVVTTITKVADQTNLLSLNAAIEAEKAGEYGRGFAVVATEIRRLADQTAVATYDIEQMVKEMLSAVSAGVMGMDKFSEEVRRGVDEVRQVGGQLAQIIQHVQAMTPRFESVNEGMQAQATGAQQISEALGQLSEAAQQTVESLRQSGQAIEQLNETARGLKAGVERIRL